MFMNVIRDCIVRPRWRRQDKCQLVLPNGVTRAIFETGLRSAVGQALKTKGALIKMRRLFGVADIKFDVVRSFQRQKILLGCRSTFLFWSSNCCCHKLPPRFLAPSAFSKYKIDNHASQGCAGGSAAEPALSKVERVGRC